MHEADAALTQNFSIHLFVILSTQSWDGHTPGQIPSNGCGTQATLQARVHDLTFGVDRGIRRPFAVLVRRFDPFF